MMIRSSSSASVSDTMRRVTCGLPCAARFALPANDPTFLAAIQAAFVKRLTLSIGQQSSSPHCARLVVDNGSGNGAITNSVAGRCQQHRRQSQRHSFFHRPHPADCAPTLRQRRKWRILTQVYSTLAQGHSAPPAFLGTANMRIPRS